MTKQASDINAAVMKNMMEKRPGLRYEEMVVVSRSAQEAHDRIQKELGKIMPANAKQPFRKATRTLVSSVTLEENDDNATLEVNVDRLQVNSMAGQPDAEDFPEDMLIGLAKWALSGITMPEIDKIMAMFDG